MRVNDERIWKFSAHFVENKSFEFICMAAIASLSARMFLRTHGSHGEKINHDFLLLRYYAMLNCLVCGT